MLLHPEMELDSVIHGFGYYDQAHFIKEFKDYFGRSPVKYLNNRLDLS